MNLVAHIETACGEMTELQHTNDCKQITAHIQAFDVQLKHVSADDKEVIFGDLGQSGLKPIVYLRSFVSNCSDVVPVTSFRPLIFDR